MSPSWLGFLALLIGLGLLLRAATRATELFCIRLQRGEARLERGRLPRALFDELVDVLRREGLSEAQVSVVVDDGRPRLVLRASSSGCEQPLRNVLGRFTLVQIRTGTMRANVR